jgi:hypothetical protein
MNLLKRVIALTLICGLYATARAAEPKVITLSCDGTLTDTSLTSVPMDHQPQPIEKMGVVVDLNERAVSFNGWVAPISSVDAASINFNGVVAPAAQGYTQRVDGYLDRVTGHMLADTMTYETKRLSDPNTALTRDHYDVLCKTTNRVF